MTEAEFASWAMKILLSGLIIFLGFIVWNLGKESKCSSWFWAWVCLDSYLKNC